SFAGWSRSWGKQRQQLCEDGEDDGPRAACLDRVWVEARSLVDALVDADAATMRNALSSVDELPSLLSCDDVEVLRQQLAPVPAGQEQRLEEHRQALAEARVQRLTGHYREASTLLQALVEAAADFDYPVFAAELAVEQANLALPHELPEQALPKLVSAGKQAERVRLDRLAAEVWTVAAKQAVITPTGPRPESADWIERAEIDSDRLDGPADLLARLDCVRGTLLIHDEATREQGRAVLERGLARLDALGDDEAGVGTRGWRPLCLIGLARISKEQQAIALGEEALASAELFHGVDHPTTARHAFVLARLILDYGNAEQYPRGAALLERAAAVMLDNDVALVDVAVAHTELAGAALVSGRYDEARQQARIAAEIYGRALPADAYEHAGPLILEGIIALGEGDPALAVTSFEKARGYLGDPGLAPQLAAVEYNLAIALLQLGRSADARPLLLAGRGEPGSDESVELMLAILALGEGDAVEADEILARLEREMSPKSTLIRETLRAVTALRRGRTLDCSDSAARLRDGAEALEVLTLVEVGQLVAPVGLSAEEAACIGWSAVLDAARSPD
ncbi:MAG: hypothetical protein KC431_06035, partial [Myxococcales bacterium]|nr:hypothetical protein [Myxococcales bacterium]